MIVSKLKRDENPTTYYAHCIWPFFGGRQEQRFPPIMGGEPDETLTLVPAAGRRTGNLAVPPEGAAAGHLRRAVRGGAGAAANRR